MLCCVLCIRLGSHHITPLHSLCSISYHKAVMNPQSSQHTAQVLSPVMVVITYAALQPEHASLVLFASAVNRLLQYPVSLGSCILKAGICCGKTPAFLKMDECIWKVSLAFAVLLGAGGRCQEGSEADGEKQLLGLARAPPCRGVPQRSRYSLSMLSDQQVDQMRQALYFEWSALHQ